LGQCVADAAEAGVTERVDLAAVRADRALLRRRTLGDDHDRRVPPLRLVTMTDGGAHVVDVEGILGDQHHHRSPTDARPQGDVTGMAPHHLDDHHAVVRLGRRVQPVDGVDADLHRGVEPERQLRADRSLSIVFGTPTTLTPSSANKRLATPSVSSPPMAMSASTPVRASVSFTRSTPPSVLY